MESKRESEALADMLRTPSIQPMHEYMYLAGVQWADSHPSEETINNVLQIYKEYCNSNAATKNRWSFYEFFLTKI